LPARRGMRRHTRCCRSLIDRSERLVRSSGANWPPRQSACRAPSRATSRPLAPTHYEWECPLLARPYLVVAKRWTRR
jgi:hypothetical protein